MAAWSPRVALVLAIVVTGCQGQGQDSTVVVGAFGSPVVNAVVDRIRSKCIFSEDRLFLRRLAHVMSRDGADSATYRPGFHGGIWQVTEKMFQDTQNCTNIYLKAACDSVSSAFGIHWPTVTWSDLRKPLYSGVAAALHTLLTLGSQSMPGSVADQANLWVQMYDGESETFSDVADQPTTTVCKDKLDLVFVLDSSGSVSHSDFQLMLNFTADVVDAMDVSDDGVKVADIVFSSSAQTEFSFADYSTKAEVKTNLLSTDKLGGGTYTHKALNLASSVLFNSLLGARADAKKVVVLVTDGHSSSFDDTQAAAQSLRNTGSTVFAVGVGNYYLKELQAVASDPICSHVLTLTSFDHIKSIVTEIQKSTCEANFQVTSNTSIDSDDSLEKIVEYRKVSADQQLTIEVSVWCGILDVYVSTTDSKPGPAVFDYRYTVRPSASVTLTAVELLAPNTIVYIAVFGTSLPPAALALCTVSFHWSLKVVPKKVVTVICEENGVQRPCSTSDVVKAGLCQQSSGFDDPIDNPCTQESMNNGVIRHSYPYDPTKFLQCDLSGRVYVTACPGGVIFNTESRECGFASPGSLPPVQPYTRNISSQTQNNSVLTPAPASVGNPCTAQALANNQYYHKYNPDKTKFIQCDEWGKAWVMPCAPSTEWSQDYYTCIKTGSASSVTCSASDDFLADPCDHHYYYRCEFQQATRMQCNPSSLFFDPNTKVCDWTDVNANPIPASCASD